MASPMIELRSVSMSFSGHRVLDNINFSLNKGEILVIAGPSGHGKTVLLKIIAGITPPTEGQVLIDGKNFYSLDVTEQDQLRRKMGMLFQKNALFDSLTAYENIAFPLIETTDTPQHKIDEKVAYFLEAVGLSHAKNLFPDEISGGMQKRLGIARALALAPDIIFYDDPTAGLDPVTSRKIVDLILKLNRENDSTAIAITNEMNRAYQLADQIGFIFGGELLIVGDTQAAQKHADPRVQQFINGHLKGPLTEYS